MQGRRGVRFAGDSVWRLVIQVLIRSDSTFKRGLDTEFAGWWKAYWYRRPSSYPGQSTTTLQRSLETNHFLESHNPSRDCLVLPLLGTLPWPPSVLYQSDWAYRGVEGVR